MKTYLKNFGVALVVLGAILLTLTMLVPAMADLADSNFYTIGCFVLIVIGLIAHILINKYYDAEG